MMLLKNFIRGIALMLVILVSQSCEERDNYDDDLDSSLNIITSLSGNNTNATIDHLQGTINLVLPPYSDPSNVELTISAPENVQFSPMSGSVVDLTKPLAVTAVVGNSTRTYQLVANVLPNQIAFLGEAATLEELLLTADDDVAAAAQWLSETYPEDFLYLDAATVSIEDLSNVNVVMFYYDQVGRATLPEVFTQNPAKSTFIQYLVEGGKLLLGGAANAYTATLGRDNSNLRTIVGSGEGGDNPDTWAVGFTGSQVSNILTAGIETNATGAINVINEGFKEDHNNMWSLDPIDAPKYANFASLYNAEVLATWDWNLESQSAAGIIYWKPKASYTGSMITIGIAGMEWNMNDGRENPYLKNVEGIYKNALDFLSTQ